MNKLEIIDSLNKEENIFACYVNLEKEVENFSIFKENYEDISLKEGIKEFEVIKKIANQVNKEALARKIKETIEEEVAGTIANFVDDYYERKKYETK